MNIREIKTEEDYQQALSRLEEIFHTSENTPEFNEAEILANQIEKFEERYV